MKLFKMKPKEMMTDFENGMRKAVKQCWRGCTLRGCWFHYCRAIDKRIRKQKLLKLLRKNINASRIRKSLMSLPLLPEESLVDGYKLIKKFARKTGLFKRFSKIFKYFEKYWLKQVTSIRPSVRFHIELTF